MLLHIFIQASRVGVLNPSDLYALMAGNYQTKVLFVTLSSQEKGETTALQGRTHPSQQQVFALLGA